MEIKVKLDSTFNLPKIDCGAFGLSSNYNITKNELESFDQAFYTK